MARQEFTAIQIDHPKIAEMLYILNPTAFAHHTYSSLEGRWVVFGDPWPGSYTMYTEDQFHGRFSVGDNVPGTFLTRVAADL